MAILLQWGDGKPELFPLRRLGGELRLSFGNPGRRAAIWKVVATSSGEVYVMERSTGGYLKTSLHKSGDWRHQWIEQHLDKQPLVQELVATKGTRVIDQWDRPPANPGGMISGITIWTTAEDVCGMPDDSPPDDIVWLHPPDPGEIGYIRIVFVRPIGAALRFTGFYR
jgi:hypothetical protein